MPENAEQDAPVQFLERMIPVWFPALKHLKPEIERAHRINSRGSLKEGDRPRAFIFCCLRFSMRQSILREARKHPPSVGNRVRRFTADFSDYTAKRRRSFPRAMAIARERGTEAFLLYPATLKVKTGHATHLFSSSADAEQFLDRDRPSDATEVEPAVEHSPTALPSPDD